MKGMQRTYHCYCHQIGLHWCIISKCFRCATILLRNTKFIFDNHTNLKAWYTHTTQASAECFVLHDPSIKGLANREVASSAGATLYISLCGLPMVNLNWPRGTESECLLSLPLPLNLSLSLSSLCHRKRGGG
jgi:hypothetical protein